ncbi:MAG: TonB family protein [Thermoanaerobaculia bacterium]
MKLVPAVLGAVLFGATLAGCREGADSRRSLRPHPEAQAAAPSEPGPWLTVDRQAESALDGALVYHQGPAPPKLLHRTAVYVPAGPGALPRGVVIVETVISPDGRVVKARVLKAPKVEGLPSAVVESLREWRFEPARLAATPVAVYYTLTLKLEPQDNPRDRVNP